MSAPADDSKPTKKYFRKTDVEIESLAQDVVARVVFGSWDIDDPQMVRMVFLPMCFLDTEALDDLRANNITNVYEYLSKAGPRSVNGMPIFMSMCLLDGDDSERLRLAASELSKLLNERKERATKS